MFGPQGAAIGAAAGAAMGLVGKSGGITETGGFTEDNQYSLGTGLIGAFGNVRSNKIKLKYKQIELQYLILLTCKQIGIMTIIMIHTRLQMAVQLAVWLMLMMEN